MLFLYLSGKKKRRDIWCLECYWFSCHLYLPPKKRISLLRSQIVPFIKERWWIKWFSAQFWGFVRYFFLFYSYFTDGQVLRFLIIWALILDPCNSQVHLEFYIPILCCLVKILYSNSDSGLLNELNHLPK